jgi:phosphatidylinositol-bisphosphatase
MTAGALLSEETKVSDKWTTMFTNTMATCESKYFTVMYRQLVGIYLIVFIKEEHRENFTDLVCHSEGVGIMGMMGNKGAISASFKLYGTTMCFVTSHFAPHTEAIQRRNQNFHELVRRCQIDNHDFIFWFGGMFHSYSNN